MRGGSGRRFSLVELMVVTAVLAVMAGLLLPALREACLTARTAACAGNLRQLGIAPGKYSAEHDDWMISAYARNRVGSWINFYYRDLCGGAAGVFRCPGLPAAACFQPPGGKGRYQVELDAGYLMNACDRGAAAWAHSSVADKEHSLGWTRGLTGHAKYALPVRCGWVRRPGAKILLVDASADFAGLSPLARCGAGRYVDRYLQTDHGPPLTGSRYASYRNVGAHHRGGFNALHGEGGVRTLRRSEDRAWVACVR